MLDSCEIRYFQTIQRDISGNFDGDEESDVATYYNFTDSAMLIVLKIKTMQDGLRDSILLG
jgi:hypothetical protein